VAPEMKDSSTTDALTDLPDTVHSSFRKSSLPDGTQKTGKPPVPVFRKRTSTGNCVVTDGTAAIQEQSTVSSLPDSVDSSKRHSTTSVLSNQRSPVKSNGHGADTIAVSDDMSAVSQSVSHLCRQQATPTPSLLSAVLATSAASIAMITIQSPSTTPSTAVKKKNGNFVSLLICCTITTVLLHDC